MTVKRLREMIAGLPADMEVVVVERDMLASLELVKPAIAEVVDANPKVMYKCRKLPIKHEGFSAKKVVALSYAKRSYWYTQKDGEFIDVEEA